MCCHVARRGTTARERRTALSAQVFRTFPGTYGGHKNKDVARRCPCTRAFLWSRGSDGRQRVETPAKTGQRQLFPNKGRSRPISALGRPTPRLGPSSFTVCSSCPCRHWPEREHQRLLPISFSPASLRREGRGERTGVRFQ